MCNSSLIFCDHVLLFFLPKPVLSISEQTETYRAEIVLKLIGPPTGGAEGGVEAGEVLVAGHLQEHWQVVRREADEVQVACPAAHGQVLQLQVHVPDAGFTIGRVGGQVPADALQVLHLLLLLFCCDIFGLKVHQLHQSPPDVHPEPREGCNMRGRKRMSRDAMWEIA